MIHIFDGIIDTYCETLRDNKVLYDISKYTLYSGKRIRPLIVIDIFNSLTTKMNRRTVIENGLVTKLNNLSLGVELLHNASLIIDDLPSMDNDSMRRGKTTLHIKYSNEIAKITANKYISDAFKLFNRSCDLIDIFIDQSNNACLGQYYDMTFNKLDLMDKSIEEKSDLINLKTSPFFIIAFVSGYYSSVDTIDTNILEKYILLGHYFGRLFQMSDDFVDLESDTKKGKYLNNVNVLGINVSRKLFISTQEQFIELILELKIDSVFIRELICLLNKKCISTFIN
jgi:geranylgeranyl diphosphate synthase type II